MFDRLKKDEKKLYVDDKDVLPEYSWSKITDRLDFKMTKGDCCNVWLSLKNIEIFEILKRKKNPAWS